MKRSKINDILARADAFIRQHGIPLPPFAYWSPEEFSARKEQIGGIIDAGLGWDVTDYGGGDFDRMGLFLFTTRNGALADLKAGGGMCYAEKIMISRKDQISPMHRHIHKTEDIINRGGATLAIRMFESDAMGGLDRTAPVVVASDGQMITLNAGDVLRLEPGASVTLRPGNWHEFWGDGGDVLITEVSGVNDDKTDNIFEDPLGRFPQVDEDCAPTHLLVSDYQTYLG